MLKGKEFGQAIGKAIDLKLKSGSADSKAAIARHFKMQPPSLADWVKKGAVSKDKLPELWRYFSDVVGPEHWGLTKSEWPAGLTDTSDRSANISVEESSGLYDIEWPFKHVRPEQIYGLTAQQREDLEDYMLLFLNKLGKKPTKKFGS